MFLEHLWAPVLANIKLVAITDNPPMTQWLNKGRFISGSHKVLLEGTDVWLIEPLPPCIYAFPGCSKH